MKKTKLFAARLGEEEATFLQKAGASTGLNSSELCRRALKLLQREVKRKHGFGFLMVL